ncbi:TPA: hypothetical protein ACHVIQ_001139, partial [Streptococcus suis]
KIIVFIGFLTVIVGKFFVAINLSAFSLHCILFIYIIVVYFLFGPKGDFDEFTFFTKEAAFWNP